MLATLVCSECNNVQQVSDRSTVLPFVCVGCRNADIPVDTPGIFVPAQDPTESQYGSQLGQEGWYPEFGVNDLPDTTATAEATIELVKDLQSQLETQKRQNERREDLLRVYQSLIDKLEEENGIFIKVIGRLLQDS